MAFASKLQELMIELNISQTQLSDLTGIGKSSISQYLSGKNEPSKARRQTIARTFNLQDDYFEKFDDVPDAQSTVVLNIPVNLAAKLMGKSKEWVMLGLQNGVFPWGYAVKMKDWSYFISSVKFTEYTGIEVPVHQ